jgi:hypothetical protein
MPSPDDHSKKSVLPVTMLRHGQTSSTTYYSYSSSRLGSSHSENITTEWPGHRAHSGGSRDRAAPKMERHHDRSPTLKSYCAQWKPLAVRNGILERHWECEDRWSKIAQIILPQSRRNDVLIELHGGPPGSHLGVNKALNKVRQKYYWLQAMMLRSGAASAKSVQPVTAPEPGIGAKCIGTISGPHSKG